MSKWNMVRLGDVATIINGRAYKQDELLKKGKYPVLRVGNFFSNKDWYYSDLELDANKYCESGDLLFAWSASFGPKIWKGQKVIYHYHIWKIALTDYIDKNYLFFFLKDSAGKIKDRGHGIAMIHTTKSEMEKTLIPLPPLDEQRRIAESLDLASSLIEKRKKQIGLLDLLAKSLFVEMFGDPVENPMGWEIVQLKDITTKIGSGATPRGGKESYKTEGIHLIRSMNVHNGRFKLLDLAFIDDKQASQLDNVVVEKDDVLINITGASVARSCIVPDNILPARVNQHVSIIRLNKKFANCQFINNVFVNINYQQKLLSLSNAGGATREAITKSQLEKLETILPPVDLQIQFANVIEAIETQKSLLQSGLEKLEMNYNALMQKYFEEV